MPQPEAYEAAAQALWDKTQTDWHVVVSLTLTEPVCALVTLTSDDEENFKGVDGFIGNGDANDSIRLACEHVLSKLKD